MTPLLGDIEGLRQVADAIRNSVPCDELSSLNHILLVVLFKQLWDNEELMDQLIHGEKDAV